MKIQLDATALQKLLDVSGPVFVEELRQAAVAEITRRAFVKYLPDEVRRRIDLALANMRDEVRKTLLGEEALKRTIEARLEDLRRGYKGASIPSAIHDDVRKWMDSQIEMTVRKMVLERLEAPEGLQQLVDKKVEELTGRIEKRLESTLLEDKIEAEIQRRADEMVQARVAAVIAGLGQAA